MNFSICQSLDRTNDSESDESHISCIKAVKNSHRDGEYKKGPYRDAVAMIRHLLDEGKCGKIEMDEMSAGRIWIA